MEARGFTKGIVATVIVAAALLNAASTAAAGPPSIHVVRAIPSGAAIGLYVAGAGGTITREGAIESLRRGKVQNALLGGKPGGQVVVELTNRSAQGPAVYLELPPPGEHPNTKRYLVAIDAPGFRGILTSDSTRIRGLVAIPDITQTAIALAQGRKPDIRAVPGTPADLRELDRRLSRVHRDRGWTQTVLILTMLTLAVVAAGAAVVAGLSAIAASMLLSALGVTTFWVVIFAVAALTISISFAASWRRRFIPTAVAIFFVVYLAVLTRSSQTNSLAVLGARPDGGGRFYGIGNQLETLMLAPLIAAIVVGGLRWLAPLGALALITVGWSKAGADGGGLVVFTVALAVLALRLRDAPVTWRRAAIAAACIAVVVLAVIGIDAALGGSSHVTRAVGSGPGSLAGDLGHRLHLSWASATNSAYKIFLFLLSLGALVWIGTSKPRRPGVDAMLAGLAVSLLLNDTPVDVIGIGAVGCLALFWFESVDSRPMRRGALTAVFVVAALALAGCGSEGVTSAKPETVVGTVKQEAPGKAIFINQGCGACHTYAPAGPEAKGNIGPDLDKLADYAKEAKQPLAAFVDDSIVDPNKYIQKGYPANVMPKSYASLPATDLKDLVDFLTTSQG